MPSDKRYQEANRLYMIAARKADPDKFRARNRDYQVRVRSTAEAKLRRKKWEKEQRIKMKLTTLSHYSQGTMSCACCGEAEVKFLTLDHINGLAPEERLADKKRLYSTGVNLYRILKRRGYPTGFQVLCFNCNCAKGFYGTCPHQQAKAAAA